MNLDSPAFWRILDRRMVRTVLRVSARPVRAVISALDAGKRLALAGLAARADETPADVEVGQHYGFASAPPVGAEVVAVPIGGSSSHLVTVAELDRAHRPTDLAAGATCLYDREGTRVDLRADGTLTLSTPSGAGVELGADGTIALNAGGAGVGRVGDMCSPSAGMATWIATVSSVLGGLSAGAVVPPTDLNYAIAAGSSTVSAGG